jgi:hypothetical protein
MLGMKMFPPDFAASVKRPAVGRMAARKVQIDFQISILIDREPPLPSRERGGS